MTYSFFRLIGKGKYRRKGKRDIIMTNDEAWERKKRDGKRDRVYLWLDRKAPYEIDSALGMKFTTQPVPNVRTTLYGRRLNVVAKSIQRQFAKGFFFFLLEVV